MEEQLPLRSCLDTFICKCSNLTEHLLHLFPLRWFLSFDNCNYENSEGSFGKLCFKFAEIESQ